MKTSILFFLFFLSSFTFKTFAQSSVIVAGGECKDLRVTMSYVVDQFSAMWASYTIADNNTSGGGTGGGTGGGGEGEGPVGIDDPKSTTIRTYAYPNPSNGIFTLELTNVDKFDDWSYSIVDFIGVRHLKHPIMEQKTSVDASELVSGTYLLIVTYKNNRHSVIKILIKQ